MRRVAVAVTTSKGSTCGRRRWESEGEGRRDVNCLGCKETESGSNRERDGLRDKAENE